MQYKVLFFAVKFLILYFKTDFNKLRQKTVFLWINFYFC